MSNENRTQFPAEVARQLFFYVYRLVDPRNGETFYVGKGKGDRVFAHAAGALKVSISPDQVEDDAVSLKLRRILEVKKSGLDVIMLIHMHGIKNEDTAHQIETAVMECYPGLTNRVSGRGAREYGVAHVDELIRLYGARPLNRQHNLLLINIGRSSQEMEIYDAVRAAWRLNKDRAEKAEYVVAHGGGIVLGVFVAQRWMKVTRENFPDRPGAEQDRWGFEGVEAPHDIKALYMGTRVPKSRKGAANPIRYPGDDD
jgi:uncharacterized protein